MAHTLGAERAGEEIRNQYRLGKYLDDKQLAEIISRETRDAEMLEALTRALACWRRELPIQPGSILHADIEALIAKVEGR